MEITFDKCLLALLLSSFSLTANAKEFNEKVHQRCVESSNYISCVNNSSNNNFAKDTCLNAKDYSGCKKYHLRNFIDQDTSFIDLAPNSDDQFEKGYYLNVGLGVGKYSDQDILGTYNNTTFQSGVNYEIGIGYDFGRNYRIELNYSQLPSDLNTILGENASSNIDINTISASGFIDFAHKGNWSPFIGTGIGLTKAHIGTVCTTICGEGESKQFASFPFIFGTSYEISKYHSLIGKYTWNYFPNIHIYGGKLNPSSTSSFLIGYRYIMN